MVNSYAFSEIQNISIIQWINKKKHDFDLIQNEQCKNLWQHMIDNIIIPGLKGEIPSQIHVKLFGGVKQHQSDLSCIARKHQTYVWSAIH